MKIKFVHITWMVFIILLSSCSDNKLPDLRETYSKNDRNPFGAYVLRNQLAQLYYQNTIRNKSQDFKKSWAEMSDTSSLYVNVSKNLILSVAEVDAMLYFVSNGNSLFISSENIDKKLLDSLGCEIEQSSARPFFSEMQYTGVTLDSGAYEDSVTYNYFYLPFKSHFKKTGNFYSTVLGRNNTGANYIVIFYGNGRFYLHTEPRAFSNYFLLQKNNYQYLKSVFAFTDAIPEHVYWDDYYNKINRARNETGNKSSLSVLFKYPATTWAFWLLLSLLILYILFGGKRRQRIIEPIVPNTNTTVAFTETISRLYLQKKDNRNIADKLITYLLEHIRNQYYLNTSHFNDEFIATLSRKSNNTKAGTALLFKSIGSIHQSMEVTDQQLLSLNQQIENFYKNKI